MKSAKLLDDQTQRVMLENLEIANTVWTRFRGWMLRSKVEPNSGILIRPCRSVHTMWMRVKIDVYFLSDDNIVLGCQENVKPWRIVVAPHRTTRVLETLAGEAKIELGTKLAIEIN